MASRKLCFLVVLRLSEDEDIGIYILVQFRSKSTKFDHLGSENVVQRYNSISDVDLVM